MIRRPADLPSALPWPVFTRAEAVRAGLSPDRMRRSDLVRVRRGMYALHGVAFREADVAAALCRNDPDMVIVGLSAARLLTIPMPFDVEKWSRHTPVHVATRGSRGRSDSTVTWHDLTLMPAEVQHSTYRLPGGGHTSRLLMTTRARTWRDLARHLSQPDLTAAGDYLVRIPRPVFEGRKRPWCTPATLRSMATGRYARKLRAAAADVRIGADSPKETMLRLAFIAAGLPEPQINVPLIGADGVERHAPDLQWQDFGVCVEYEGERHNDEEQIQRDIRRARAVKAAGCVEIRLYKNDLTDECAAAVRMVRAELIERGWRPRS